MNNQTTQMPQLTVENYQQVLPENVQEMIANLVAEHYCLDDMIDFINEHDEDDFCNHYVTYVELGEEYSYDAVDAFIYGFGIDKLANFIDAHYGQYETVEDFCQEYINDVYGYNQSLPVVIDWTATWEQHFAGDFTFQNGYIFRTTV